MRQGYLDRLKLEDAWAITKGDSGEVVIAAVDIGLDIEHEDISPNLWVNSDETAGNNIDDDGNGYVDDINGWNFSTGVADPSHSNSTEDHGTKVTGAANAATDNAVGVAGAAWNAQSMGIHAGCSLFRDRVCFGPQGIIYAYSNGADIINLSFGRASYSSVEHEAIKSAVDAGALVISAAGNSSTSNDENPILSSELS